MALLVDLASVHECYGFLVELAGHLVQFMVFMVMSLVVAA